MSFLQPEALNVARMIVGKIRRQMTSDADADRVDGFEWDLLPHCQNSNVMVMAYSPLGQGPILRNAALKTVADRHGVEPAAIALAWILRHQGVIAIPKATNPAHVRANARARDVRLTADDLSTLDHAFPPPKRAAPLGML